MKKYFLIAIALIISTLIISAQSTKSGQTAKQNTKSEVTLYIAKMECENCKKKITDKISYEKGVKDLKFDLQKRMLTITYDAKKTTIETLKAVLAKIGFEAKEPSEVKVCPSTQKACSPGCAGHRN